MKKNETALGREAACVREAAPVCASARGRECVRVIALGSAADALGWSEQDCPLPPDGQLASLMARLEGAAPRLAAARGRLRYAVNQRYAAPKTMLCAGDEVAIIPPVSGG